MICAVCCGTKREVEIDCPSSCPHLIAGRSYEAEKRALDPQLAAKAQSFDTDFIYRFSPVLNALSGAVVEERIASPWLVDPDVIEVFKALGATMKTLSSGIYYETLPEGPIRLALFRRLRAVLDGLMQPNPETREHTLRTSEAVEVMDFLILVATAHSNARPKSRQYLDWLSHVPGAAQAEQPSSLIFP